MTQAKANDWVKVSYTGRLDNGEVVDSTEHRDEPFEFQVGEGRVIEGFEKAVVGMEPGETKSFRLDPEEAYGVREEGARVNFPKDRIPEEFGDVETGQIVTLVNEKGDHLPGQIAEVKPETVTVDLNHPLAGQPINFEVKLLEVLKDPAG
jgi:peptidylprolyl isomerase